MIAHFKQAGSQLLQLLLQLSPDLRQTLTLPVLQFQFLNCVGKISQSRLKKEGHLHRRHFYGSHNGSSVSLCVCNNTFFAASSCSLRISEPFSLISFSLISSERLRSRERSPWSLPEGGPALPPPSSLDLGSGSRSTNLT